MTSLRDRCADLIGTIENLHVSIETENRMLEGIEEGRTPEIDLDAKRQLAAIYAEQMKAVQDRLKAGEAVDRLSSDLMSQSHSRLSEVMAENRALLRRSHTATSRMVSLIVDTARENMPKDAPSYSAPSSRAAKVRQADHSLALNVTL